jgi:hypothetical protein
LAWLFTSPATPRGAIKRSHTHAHAHTPTLPRAFSAPLRSARPEHLAPSTLQFALFASCASIEAFRQQRWQ